MLPPTSYRNKISLLKHKSSPNICWEIKWKAYEWIYTTFKSISKSEQQTAQPLHHYRRLPIRISDTPKAQPIPAQDNEISIRDLGEEKKICLKSIKTLLAGGIRSILTLEGEMNLINKLCECAEICKINSERLRCLSTVQDKHSGQFGMNQPTKS